MPPRGTTEADRNGAVFIEPDTTPQRPPDTLPPASQMSEDELRAAEPDLIEYLFRSVDRSATGVAVLDARQQLEPLLGLLDHHCLADEL